MTKKTILTAIIMSMVIVTISLTNISLFPPKVSLQEIQEVQASGESWYAESGTWNYRKKITIDRTKVVDVADPSTTYANFPILISTTGLSNVNTNGSDVRFTMADGITEIPREIESYNSGNLEAWVKLTLTKDTGDSTNDEIYIYYGNSSATEPLASSEFGSENVWNSNFVMVQHMEESDIDGGIGDIKDSTSYGNNGTTSGMDNADQVAGQVDGSFDFDATDDKINVGSGASLDNLSPLSISMWAKANSAGQAGQGYFIQKGAWGGANGWRFQKISTDSTVYFLMDYSTTDLKVYANSRSLVTEEFAHWYITSDETAVNTHIYKNGIDVSGSRTDGVGSRLDDSSKSVYIGNTTDDTRTFHGILDEVRISNTVRAGEWIKTEFNNQNNPTTFLTFGSLETSLACLSIGGVCRDNACSEYLDCALLSGNCDTNNCCVGSCTTDIEIPTTPTNFSATAVSTSQIDLSWTASMDNGGVEGYNIYRCSGSSCSPTIIINTSSTNSYSDIGLTQDILYTYAVSAYDAVPLESAKSSFAQVTIEPIAPANITNLSISSCADNSCNLTWTAPGDDNNDGTATSYDIRYSTLNITEDNWNSIMQVANESNPQTAGITETHTATGLNPGTNYYFAIKTKDEVLNESGLSNIVNATTGGIISGTLAYQIISTNDDSRFVTGSGYLSNLTSEYIDYTGRDPYMRFQIDIPKNTTITSAVIKLVPSSQNLSNSDIKIHLIDSDNCPTFTGAERYANTDTYIDYAFDGTIWNSKLNNTENPYEITGLQSLVQAYVDRSGYDYRQYIGFHFAQFGSADYKTFYTSNKGLDYYPELVVSYTGGDTVVSEVYMSEPHVKIKQKLYCQLVNTKEGDKLVVTVDGAEQVNRTLSSYTKDEEIVTVDYTGLTAGDHSLVVQVKNSAGVSYPANFTKNWTTIHNGIPKVGIDENNTICLDGTPFFPISVFIFNKYLFDTSPISPTINSVLGEGYYDVHTVKTWKNYLGRANDKGWYAIGPTGWDGFSGRDSDTDKLQNYVQEAKNYDAMLMWSWDDEPNIGGIDKYVPAIVMKNWLDLTHKNDTNHPVLITYYGYEFVHSLQFMREYSYLYNENKFDGNKTAVHDVLSLDYYPYEYVNHYFATNIEKYLLTLDRAIEWNYNLFPLHTFIESQDVHDNYGSAGVMSNPYLNISNISGSFQAGETIIANSGGTGMIPNEHHSVTIKSFVRPEYGIMILENKEGVFNLNDTLTGQISGATATYLSLSSKLGGWPKTYDWTPGPTPIQLKNKIWTSIIHGTKAISYFQYFCKVPAENILVMQDFKDWMEAGLDQIVLSGDPTTTVTLSETGAGRIDHMTKDYNGTTYIFAARVKKETGDNPGNETATFTVSGLTAGTNIAVYEEGRNITAGNGTFQDAFADHDVHIYEIGGLTPVDTTPPTFTINDGTETGPVLLDVINITASDETNLKSSSLAYGFSADNTCNASDTYGTIFINSRNFTISTNHTDYLCVKASDVANNIAYKLVGKLNVIQDTTPPANISNLSSSSKTQTSIELTWTSPGDDNNTGTASTYDLRYSTSNITELNFNNANQLSGEPIPAIVGSSETYTVVGLSPNTKYHFAIKTKDEANNISGISNIIEITTKPIVLQRYMLNLRLRNELGNIINNAIVRVYATGEEDILPDFTFSDLEKSIEMDEGLRRHIRYLLPQGQKLTIKEFALSKETTLNPQFVFSYSGTLPNQIQSRSSVIALDDTDLNYDSADITLSTTGEITHILHCANWNFETAICVENSWEIKPLSDYAHTLNTENTLLTLTSITNFDAYIAGYGETPNNIADLSASDPTTSSIKLSWTVPENQENAISSYNLRYSTANITNDNWNQATEVNNEPTPTEAGTTQTITIDSLSSGTTYYFAIKTIDETNQESELSNIANKTTTIPNSGGNTGGGGGSYSDTTPPSTPSEFTATSAVNQIHLSWKNPTDVDFVRVKILRKCCFAPTTHNDETAEVIYEGSLEEYTDTDLNNDTIYYYSIFAYDQKPNYSQILTIQIQTIQSQTNSEPIYPNGTIIKIPESFKVYIIIDNKKKWIPTPEVFETLGYQWGEITIISKTNLNKIPNYEDNLIRAINDYKVYLIVNGISRHLPNPEIFLDYGFSWEDVIDVPQTTIDQYQRAYLIRESRQGKIYYLRNDGIKKHIPNAEVFSSYNNKWDDIQVISKKEMESYVESSLIQLEGDNGIWLIEDGFKRYISSAEIFNKHQFNWDSVVKVNEVEFGGYGIGNEVR